MKMSIKQLRAFLAVAHTLNFAQASERLNISQPALSLAIRGLEDALGGPLLLTPTDSAGVPLATASVVERLHPRRLVVFGGPAAVSEEAYRTAGTLLRG